MVLNPAAYAGEEALRRGVADLVYHEFGHSFTNPIVDALAPRVEATAALFGPLRAEMARQAYVNWAICVREHFVRAAAARLIRGERGDVEGRAQVADDLSRGFRYLPPLYRALGDYEKDRAKYRRIGDFAPRLMEELEKIAREGAEAWWAGRPFAGRINDAWNAHKEKLVFVVPREERTAEYARSIARRFKPEPRVVRDEEALALKPADHVFVVYGTAGNNALLAGLADRLPFKVEESGVTVDGAKVEGNRLRLIAAVPHPAESRLPLLVYTATSADLVHGINGVFHGPTGFLVAGADGKEIRKGFFAGDL